MQYDDEEIVAVIYHETDGEWRPHAIQTRTPRREFVAGVTRSERPRLPGYFAEHYDSNYSKAYRSLYVHNSGCGGDGNDVHVHAYVEAEAMPGRIWLHPEAYLTTWSAEEKRSVPMDRSGLAAMGYQLLPELPSDPFEDTCEGDTTWCDVCEDNIPDNDNDTFDCAVCCERAHEHGVGQAFVVIDGDDVGMEAGLYRVTRLPYHWSGLVGSGGIYKDAVERVGPLPEKLDEDAVNGHPCAHVCDACRDRLVARP
jgi:hypothetical protein